MNVASTASADDRHQIRAQLQSALLQQLDSALDMLGSLRGDPRYSDSMYEVLEGLPAQLDALWPQGWPKQVTSCQRPLLGELAKMTNMQSYGRDRAFAYDCLRFGLAGLHRQVKALA